MSASMLRFSLPEYCSSLVRDLCMLDCVPGKGTVGTHPWTHLVAQIGMNLLVRHRRDVVTLWM